MRAPHTGARRTWGVCTSYQGQTGPAWSQQIKRGLSCRSLGCACSEWVVSELAANLVSSWVLGLRCTGKLGCKRLQDTRVGLLRWMEDGRSGGKGMRAREMRVLTPAISDNNRTQAPTTAKKSVSY